MVVVCERSRWAARWGPRGANPRNEVRSGVPIPGGCCGSEVARLVQPGRRCALSGGSREQPASEGLWVSGGTRFGG